MKEKYRELLPLSGVTYPKGFQAAGVSCGIKEGGLKDLAVVVSERRATAAAVYTTNLFKAAPLLVTEGHLADGGLYAVVCNSGNANSFTGQQGFEDALFMADEVARLLGVPGTDVAVASTGVIGVPLPMDKIRQGIRMAVGSLSPGGGWEAAEAILTTDTHSKELIMDGEGYRLGAMAKGAGMIAPNMATMLCFITTDALVDYEILRKCLKEAVDQTFNMITVDGCNSTNDMVLIMANGTSRIKPANDDFGERLLKLCGRLAYMLVEDGEGCTKVIEVRVDGAESDGDAKRAAMAVGNSLLVKTAFYGGDPNWGRIIAALGSSGAYIEIDKLSLSIDHLPVVEKGRVCGDLSSLVIAGNALVSINLGIGEGEARIFTSDLSEEYVRINAKYTT